MNTELIKKTRPSLENLSTQIRLKFDAAIKGAAINILKKTKAECKPLTFEEWHRLEFRKEYPRKRCFGDGSSWGELQ